MSLDIANDYTLFDNTEPVIVTLSRSDGETDVSVVNAMRQPLTKSDIALFGASLQRGSAAFFIPSQQLNPTGTEGREPEPGDTISPAAQSWSIQEVFELRLGSSLSGWRCLVYRQLS